MAPIHSSRRRLYGTLLMLVAATAFVSAAAEQAEALAARHERWMAKHGRLYTDATEKLRRQEVFAANVRHVDAVNRAGNRTYMLGLNQFSDLTNEEFAEKHLGYRHQRGGLRPEDSTPVAMVNMSKVQFRSLPESVDWRAQGAVTPVKNQGSCGCCWAFAAVAVTEGLVKIATGNLISMSEQQVLDCTGGANTCNGGSVKEALNYIAESGGLQPEKNYAYSGQHGACRIIQAMANSAAYVSYFQSVSLNGDEVTLQELVSRQPVAVSVEADSDFQHYMSGILTGSSSCGQNLNYAVTVVGYGTDSGGQEYWTVKNQWGATWGEGGYMRLTRGNGANCGMATYAYYPTYVTSSGGDKGNGTKAKENGNSSNANVSNPSRNSSHLAILPIVLPVVTTLGLISAISIFIWRKRSSLKKTQSYTACSEDIEDIKSVLLDTSIIRIATSNFSEENKLGEGGFGHVYKGMMPDGQEIAVKRLSEGSKQGLRELKNELLLVAKLQHRNLVKLIGACLNGEDKLLVYEYIPKKSLDAFIFDDEKRGKLAWDTRYKIICGIARGLVYLHDESRIKVIHRDLKPSNILLEMDMNPKISDFGLASIFEGDHTKHITRRVAGTYGYMAPEYAVLGHVSTKSDVFSFGMIILEIVTGRRNSVSSETMMAEHLLTYVWENWTKGTKAEIVDPSLHYNYSSENEVLKCVHIGLLCVQENPGDRPGMSNVILMLVGKSTTLPAPSRPAFLFRLNDENHAHGGLNNLLDGSNKSNSSVNKLTITELEPR